MQPAPGRRLLLWGRRTLRWLGRWGLRLLLALLVLVAVLLLALHLWALPRLDQWRPALERYASRVSGLQVDIGQLQQARDADSGFALLPTLVAHEVRVRDANALLDARVQQVQLRVSPASLWRLGLDSLVLQGPQVRMALPPRTDHTTASPDTPDTQHTADMPWQALRWLLTQPELRVEQGRWELWPLQAWRERTAAESAEPAKSPESPAHIVQDVQLHLRHGLLGARHQIEASLTPQGMGPVRLLADLRVRQWPDVAMQPAPPWPLVQGQSTLHLHDADLHRVQQWLNFLQSGDEPTTTPQRAPQRAQLGLQGAIDGQIAVQWDVASDAAPRQRVRDAEFSLQARDVHVAAIGAQTTQIALAWDNAQLQGRIQGPAQGLPGLLRDAQPSWRITGLQWQAQRGAQQWALGPLDATLELAQSDQGATLQLRSFSLQADELDAGALAALTPASGARALPTDVHPFFDALVQAQTQWRRWQPAGRLRDLQLQWQAKEAAANTWSAQATLERITLGMSEGHGGNAPVGVQHLSGQVHAHSRGGQAQLRIDDGALQLPTVFEESRIPVGQLQADAQWQIDEDGAIALQIDAPQVRNAHAQGSAKVQWRTSTEEEIAAEIAAAKPGTNSHTNTHAKPPARLPGHLDLQARLTRADATQTWRYLPLSIPEPVRRYVREGVRKGQSQQVDFEVRGPLRHFPFEGAGKGKGIFRIHADVEQVEYRYAPHYLLGSDAPALVWPDLADVKAQLLFEGSRMQIDVRSGHLLAAREVRVTRGQARIDDLRKAMLHVEAQAQGPLQPQLRLLATTPVARMTGHVMDNVRGTGQAGLRLALSIPLYEQPATAEPAYSVQGEVQLQGADLHWLAQVPQLHDARGVVQFNEKGFTVKDLNAQALGGPVQVQAAMQELQAGQPVRVDVQAKGRLAAEGVQTYVGQLLEDAGNAGNTGKASNTGNTADAPGALAQRLLRGLHGAADYTLQVHTIDTRAFVTLESDTQGLGSRLPAPLHKPAEAARALRFTHTPPDEAGQETVELQWGERLYARYRLGAPREPKTTALNVRDGVVLVGAFSADERRLSSFIPNRFASAPVAGNVQATIAWERWNAADWLPWLQGESTAAPAATDNPDPIAALAAAPETRIDTRIDARAETRSKTHSNGKPAAAETTAHSPWPGIAAFIPAIWHGQFQHLQWGDMVLHDVALQTYQDSAQDKPIWITRLHAQEAQGTLEYHPHYLEDTGLLRGKLARVELPADFGQAQQDQAAASASTNALTNLRQLPTVDLEIERLQFAGRDWGKAALQAINRVQDGQAREWRINYLTLEVPEARLSAKGSWRDAMPDKSTGKASADAASTDATATAAKAMDMRFTLELRDAGQLLARLGLPDVLHAGAGQLDGRLAWRGSPLKFDLPSLEGAFHLDVQQGQFLSVDAGAARLLGVLSLQALPRRLNLDFRDVFSDGFAFDFVRGDVQLYAGQARTNNLQMQGVNAGVVLEGMADLVRETQDVKVLVVPELDAMTASLVATAINPAVGAGTLIAQLFFSKPLAQSAAREFRIQGTWSAPKVERTTTRARAPEHMPAAGDGG